MYNWISLRYMSFQGNSMPTAPTMQMRPRSRHRLKACCAGAGDFEAAATMAQSTPRPLVRPRHVQLDFLEVHVVPGELHAHRAHDADAAAVAAQAQSVLRRRRRFRGRRHDGAIHAASVGEAATCTTGFP